MITHSKLGKIQLFQHRATG